MLSHLDPSLHDPAPYPTLIRTSYPCQPTPHTQGIPSLPSPALLCAFFDLPVHFRAPTISFLFTPQPALFHPPAFIPTPHRLGALSTVGALRRRHPALCACDVVPCFRTRFTLISIFVDFHQVFILIQFFVPTLHDCLATPLSTTPTIDSLGLGPVSSS